MGLINKYICECGYHEKLFVGGSMFAEHEEMVRRAFGGDLPTAFETAKQHGTLTKFFLASERSVCPACRRLMATSVLHFWDYNRERKILQTCPDCGGEVELIFEKDTSCPKCGGMMIVERAGHWD